MSEETPDPNVVQKLAEAYAMKMTGTVIVQLMIGAILWGPFVSCSAVVGYHTGQALSRGIGIAP